MAKVKPKDIPKKERQKMIGEFFDVIVQLNTKKEVIDFFVGMITPSEALMFSRRMQIAKMLINKKSYDSITNTLNVGKGTVSQVDKWLFERDGVYKKILGKYVLNEKPKSKKLKGLDRYPGHLLAKQLLGLDYFSD